MEDQYEGLMQFREWVQQNLVRPGVVTLHYAPNTLMPESYSFSPCPDDEKPSVGVRVWLKDWKGDIFDVDYCTAYPEFREGESRADMDALPDKWKAEAWRVGWQSIMLNAAHVISNLQTKLMYDTASRLSFDLDGFLEKAEKYLPEDVASQYAVTYLSFLHTRSVLADRPQDERHKGIGFMLEMVEEILGGVRTIALGGEV
jgi:hypothetical protein